MAGDLQIANEQPGSLLHTHGDDEDRSSVDLVKSAKSIPWTEPKLPMRPEWRRKIQQGPLLSKSVRGPRWALGHSRR